MNRTMLDWFSPSNDLSLYIHVPFCRSKCAYCGFYSTCATSDDGFYHKLSEELRIVAEWRQAPFDSIFFGGGNPAMLQVEQLLSLVNLACSNGKPVECSIEMNPETLSEAHRVLFEQGANRLSVGIQSFDESLLSVLGRNATLRDNLNALQHAASIRDKTGAALNFDLMTCIPGQSVGQALADIDRLVETVKPDHISLYGLTVEEGTPFARLVESKVLEMGDEETQADMLYACWERLADHGYDHYEVSNFALKGTMNRYCRHNLRYWDLQPYLGLGPSAAGTAVQDNHLIRFRGFEDTGTYAESSAFSQYEREDLNKKEELEEYLIVALRTRWGISKARFIARFGMDFDTIFAKAVAGIKKSGKSLIDDSPYVCSLTESGWMVMQPILLELAACIEND